MAIEVTDIGKSGLYVVEHDNDVYVHDNYDDAVTCNRTECNDDGEYHFHGFSKRPTYSEAEMTVEYFYPNQNIINRV